MSIAVVTESKPTPCMLVVLLYDRREVVGWARARDDSRGRSHGRSQHKGQVQDVSQFKRGVVASRSGTSDGVRDDSQRKNRRGSGCKETPTGITRLRGVSSSGIIMLYEYSCCY